MKPYIPVLILLGLVYSFTPPVYSQTRQTISLNNSWKFYLNKTQSDYVPGFNDDVWTIVDLPHTWNATDGYNENYFKGTGWYSKEVLIPEIYAGQRIYLKFEHANLVTQLYINGIEIGRHEGGYASFIFDISSYVIYGSKNIIAVKVVNSVDGKVAPLSGDFTFFGGITGSVQLIVANNINICLIDYASPGVYVTQKSLTASKADISVKVLIDNYNEQEKLVTIVLKVLDPANITVANLQKTLSVPAGSLKFPVTFEFAITDPVLWDARNNPYLYNVNVLLKEVNSQLDEVSQPLGIRNFEIRPDSGFYLNGKSYPLFGVNLHEDRPGKGRAVNDNDRLEDLNMMKDLGVSFLRLAHYQHGPFTYDYADKNGIILWTEIPLIDHINTAYPENFRSNIKDQLRELIRQNYNHPSVCFWGLFNEILNQPGPDPVSLITELNELAHLEDPGRPTVAANNQPDYPVNVSNITDLISHNRYFGWYYGKSTDLSAWIDQIKPGNNAIPPGISEYGGGASIFHHELNPPMPGVLTPAWHPEELQSKIHEDYWNIILKNPGLWQTSAWVAFDFASFKKTEGDQTGINDKGLITRDRKTKKDAYYFYKSQWTKDPLIYITSRRFHLRESGTTYIKAYSNCDSVELLINNRSLGYKKPSGSVFTWNNFVLSEGANFLKARGFCGNKYVADSCTWIYRRLSLEPQIKINFQTKETETPKGYLGDTGDMYPHTENNLTFGWNMDNSANSRDRKQFDIKLYDTFNHFQKSGINYVWDINLSNGLYYVELVAGDPQFFDSHHKLLVENRLFLDGVPDESNMWIYSGDTVSVKDGKLTVAASPDAMNSKINFLQITRVDSINLSTGKKVKQSSTIYNSNAERAIDGNTDGQWINGSVTHTDADAHAWWEIDLGRISKINSVEIWNRTDNCCMDRLSDYYILISNDPFISQDLNTTLSQPNIWIHHQLSSPQPNQVFSVNRTGRYMRVQLNKTGNLSIAEILVNGYAMLMPQTPTNLISTITPDNTIRLNWIDNSSDETGFIVERKSDLGYYSVIDTLGPDITEFEDSEVSGGNIYHYRLKAFNPVGESLYSNEICDTLISEDVVNLAKDGEATQSSTLYGSYASLANDQNTNGIWINGSVSHTAEETNPWWEIDLGTACNINSVTIWNRTDCCKVRLTDFYVLVSESPFESNILNQLINDPGIWYDFFSEYPDPSLTCGVNRKGRYVRIQLAGNGPLSLAEVVINGAQDSQTLVNIAPDKRVEQSNTVYGGIPERAIDNNTDGKWTSGSVTHTSVNTNSWWQIDLGKSCRVSSIEVWNRTDCCMARLSNYYIFVSNEPFLSYNPDQTINQPGVWSLFKPEYPDVCFTAYPDRIARYIRIQLRNPGELSLAEVKIFGTPETEITENLALDAAVSQISTIYGSIPGKAIDGNTDGVWINGSVTHTGNEINSWWEADLGGLCNIASVEIFNRTDCCMNRLSEYYLLVSKDPFNNHDLNLTLNQAGVWNHYQSQYPDPTQLIEVNNPGRYVRIQLTKTNNLSLAEVIIRGNRTETIKNAAEPALMKDHESEMVVIYPVPAKDVIYINNALIIDYAIFNLYGVLLQTEKCSTGSCNEISVNGLLPGIYVIKLRLGDGNQKILRFIKD